MKDCCPLLQKEADAVEIDAEDRAHKTNINFSWVLDGILTALILTEPRKRDAQ